MNKYLSIIGLYFGTTWKKLAAVTLFFTVAAIGCFCILGGDSAGYSFGEIFTSSHTHWVLLGYVVAAYIILADSIESRKTVTMYTVRRLPVTARQFLITLGMFFSLMAFVIYAMLIIVTLICLYIFSKDSAHLCTMASLLGDIYSVPFLNTVFPLDGIWAKLFLIISSFSTGFAIAVSADDTLYNNKHSYSYVGIFTMYLIFNRMIISTNAIIPVIISLILLTFFIIYIFGGKRNELIQNNE